MTPKVFFRGALPPSETAIVSALSSTLIVKTIVLTNTRGDWANVALRIKDQSGQGLGLFVGQLDPKDVVLIESTLILEPGMFVSASGDGVEAYIAGVEYA